MATSPRAGFLDKILVEAGTLWEGQIYARLLKTGNLLSLVLHLLFALTFGFLGVWLLVWVNLGLVSIDLAAMGLLKAGWRKRVELGSQFLILANSSLNVLWLGWDAGFHYYVLQLLPLVLLGIERPRVYKVGATLFITGLLGGLFLATRGPTHPAGLGPQILANLYLVNLVLVLVLMAVQITTFSRGVAAIALRLRDTNEQLNTIAFFDPLTGLLNRRALWDRLGAEIARCRRRPPGIVVALADIDGFKEFNDRWGHDLGDRVLAHVASVLKGNLRQEDLVGRWGGEEFLLVLTETDETAGAETLERLRTAVSLGAVTTEGHQHTVNITVGFAAWAPGESPEMTISRADSFLLTGKRAGKNRVVGPGKPA